MKEIDFLPQWYKTGRRRRIGYRTQYMVIFGIFAAMIVWSALTGYSIASARGHINRMKNLQTTNSIQVDEYHKIKKRLQELSSQASIIDAVKSKISVSKVLGELAFLIDQRIVLSELDIRVEPFNQGGKVENTGGSMITVVQGANGDKKLPLEGDIRFKVLVTGMAMNAGDVARLVRTFENSSYVRDVRPMFSRNKKMKDYQVTEFQISCYIANYIEEN
jgi:hypothetical protein